MERDPSYPGHGELPWRSAGDLSEAAEVAMWLTSCPITAVGGSRRWRAVRRRKWRGLVAGEAVELALELAGEERQWRLGFDVLKPEERGGGNGGRLARRGGLEGVAA
jgi:hypothetical protein